MALETWQLVLAGFLLVALATAYLVWRRARTLRSRTGLPTGEVIYADTNLWEQCAPLYSSHYRLSGKPDYLVRQGGETIPVELKPRRRATEPYASDVMQLAAYCLLVEESYGQRPPYGLLRYRECTFRIPFGQQMHDDIVDALEQMRACMSRRAVSRSHDDPVRCRYCGQRAHCDQALV